MNTILRPSFCFASLVLLAGSAALGGDTPCKSGPQLGQRPGPYTFVVSTGDHRGKSHCFVCETGDKPAVIVFARSLSDPLGKLVQGLDKALAEHKKADLRAWLTVLNTDQPKLDPEVVQWGQKHALKTVPLGVFEDESGPPGYKLAKDADVTVLLFVKQKVAANFAFRAKELTDEAVGTVLEALPKIVGEGEVPKGFEPLYNGKDLTGWKVFDGKQEVWGAEKEILFVKGSGGGWLMTEKEYGDFEVRLEYKVPAMGNSGVALRAPLEGKTSEQGMEIQILDDAGYKDKNLKPTQFTGSIYDVVPPSKQVAKPAGEWNQMKIIAQGRKITVELNGTTIVDANLDDCKDHFEKHPGLKREKGHLGLQSHDGRVEFRKIHLKPL